MLLPDSIFGDRYYELCDGSVLQHNLARGSLGSQCTKCPENVYVTVCQQVLVLFGLSWGVGAIRDSCAVPDMVEGPSGSKFSGVHVSICAELQVESYEVLR